MIKTKMIGILIAALMVVGCAGLEISDNANSKATAYVSGKGLGFAINSVIPEVDGDLSEAWDKMIERNDGAEMVSSENILQFYNECIGIIALHTSDPYGLIADLGVLLMLFGGEFGTGGELVSIEPVPLVVLQYFSMGYDNGRMVALN